MQWLTWKEKRILAIIISIKVTLQPCSKHPIYMAGYLVYREQSIPLYTTNIMALSPYWSALTPTILRHLSLSWNELESLFFWYGRVANYLNSLHFKFCTKILKKIIGSTNLIAFLQIFCMFVISWQLMTHHCCLG